jgi:hypothetical protein
MGFLQRYRNRLQHEHGWQVEVKCSNCGHTALPSLKGWTPSRALHFGDRPTVFANVACSNCGDDLREEAGDRLVSLFAGVAAPTVNSRLIAWFWGLVIGVPFLLVGLLFTGVQSGWWSYQAFMALIVLSLFVAPSIMWFNYRVASIRCQCQCGRPAYVFMGLLGRSSCYRCASCGNLLRLRD